MDGYKSQLAGAGSCVLAILCLCSLTCLVLLITFIVFLGIFAFANPNNAAFYGVDTAGVETLYATQNPTGDLTDVHGDFVTWFTWGFYQQMLPVAGLLLVGIATMINASLAKFCQGVVSIGSVCGSLAWIIAGLVWRFRASGKFASGDSLDEAQLAIEEANAEVADSTTLYQLSSGKFMYVYYYILGVILAIVCGCSIGNLITACFCK